MSLKAIPRPIERLLAADATSLIGRIALTCAYWWGALAKLLDFPGALAEAHHFGLEPAVAVAVATIAVELTGSAMIILGFGTWLAAGTLSVFTLLATVIAHDFWNMQGIDRFSNLNSFLEHIGLIGGFVLVAVLDYRRAALRS
jgi:transmembrane protein